MANGFVSRTPLSCLDKHSLINLTPEQLHYPRRSRHHHRGVGRSLFSLPEGRKPSVCLPSSALVSFLTIRALGPSSGAPFRDVLTGVNSVWRSSIILTFVSCYLMWGMSYPLLLPVILCLPLPGTVPRRLRLAS